MPRFTLMCHLSLQHKDTTSHLQNYHTAVFRLHTAAFSCLVSCGALNGSERSRPFHQLNGPASMMPSILDIYAISFLSSAHVGAWSCTPCRTQTLSVPPTREGAKVKHGSHLCSFLIVGTETLWLLFLWAVSFRGGHGESPALLSPCPLHPLLSHSQHSTSSFTTSINLHFGLALQPASSNLSIPAL